MMAVTASGKPRVMSAVWSAVTDRRTWERAVMSAGCISVVFVIIGMAAMLAGRHGVGESIAYVLLMGLVCLFSTSVASLIVATLDAREEDMRAWALRQMRI